MPSRSACNALTWNLKTEPVLMRASLPTHPMHQAGQLGGILWTYQQVQVIGHQTHPHTACGAPYAVL